MDNNVNMENPMIVPKTKIGEFISEIRNHYKAYPSYKIVFTNGCFDILHAGHVDYLNKAKKKGNFLVVALNSDKSIRIIKGKNRPIVCQFQRAQVLDGLQAVDAVVIFDEVEPLELIEEIKPDVLVKGADWETKDIIGKDFVESYGGEVCGIPFRVNTSTSSIINKVKGNKKLNEDVFKTALEKWGSEAQIGMCIEESGEMLAKINQLARGRIELEELVEEFVDVYIMMCQMRWIHKDAFDKIFNHKVRRIRKKLGLDL